MISDYISARVRLFFLFALLVMVAAQLVVSGVSWVRVQHALNPAIDRKAAVIADSLSRKTAGAVALGVPLDRLVGVEDYFNYVLRVNPDIAWIGLQDDGRVLFSSGVRPVQTGENAPSAWEKLLEGGAVRAPEASRPVAVGPVAGGPVAVDGIAGEVRVTVAADPAFARRQLRDVLFDLLAVMLVSLFIAAEFVRYAMGAHVAEPLNALQRLMRAVGERRLNVVGESVGGPVGAAARILNDRILRLNRGVTEAAQTAAGETARRLKDATERFRFAPAGVVEVLRRSRIADARLFVFLFMFAEGLARPFLPVYVKGFADQAAGLPHDVAAGLPITVFMLVAALSMPWAGALSQRMGRRGAFILGAAASAAGLFGSGLAFSYYDLLAWRVLDALGYSIMFMACQDLVIDHTPPEKRAQGVAVFIGGIMAAEICAPAVGGILADRIGDRMTFVLSGALTALTLLTAIAALKAGERTAAAAAAGGAVKRKNLVGMLARNHRFVTLAVFAGIPAKMLLTGFLFYMVPVFLAELGASRSEIGRIAMIYGLPTLFLTVAFSRIADRWRLHGFMAGTGGLIASLGMLPILFWTDVQTVMLAVFALGLGQAMSISPQVTLAAKLTEMESSQYGHGPVLGIYRLIERCGSALGPVVFGFLTAALGHADAMALGGALTAVSVLIFCVVFLVAGIEPEEEEDDASGAGARRTA